MNQPGFLWTNQDDSWNVMCFDHCLHHDAHFPQKRWLQWWISGFFHKPIFFGIPESSPFFWISWNIQQGFIDQRFTLQETNISPKKCHFEDDFPFPKVGYVNSLEGIMHLVSLKEKIPLFRAFNWPNRLNMVSLASPLKVSDVIRRWLMVQKS